MRLPNKGRDSKRFLEWDRGDMLTVITVIPSILLASFFLLLGVVHLISPDVPPDALGENTRVCAMLILTGAALIYALFRPYSGGYFLLILAFPFAAIFHFHFIFGTQAILLLLLGWGFVTRGRLHRMSGNS